MLNWLQCCVAAVRWGNAFSFWFTIHDGVHQGGLLSPLLFSMYMDVLIFRLQQFGLASHTLICWLSATSLNV